MNHFNEGLHVRIVSMCHYPFCYHSSSRVLLGNSLHSFLSLIGSQLGLLCLLTMYFFAKKPTNGGVNACAILRPNNFDRPFILSFSVKNHLAPSGLERQHWCANQV